MEWKELKVKSSKLKVNNKPEEYFVDKGMKCDVWVNPSIVVEIKADEITKSPIHTAHLALRFPRLERFRDDKKQMIQPLYPKWSRCLPGKERRDDIFL